MRKLMLVLVLILWAGGTASAALRVDITKGIVGGLPIAIVPFKYEGAGQPPVDIARIIETDLKRSGTFDPLARNMMLAQPHSTADVNYKNWRVVDVNNIVVGSVAAADGRVTVEFALLDVYGGRQMASYTIGASESKLREVGHRIADLVYQQLTGKPGAFETRLAYVSVDKSDKAHPYRLIVSDYDGYAPRIVTKSTQPIMSPAWSPDGRRLAFVTFKNAHAVVYVQDLQTGKVSQISGRPGLNSAPAWSPDGRTLALSLSYEGNPDVYLLDLNSGKIRNLTKSPAIDTEPSWSPDGRRILFTSDRGGRPQLYVVDRDGGSPKRLTFDGQSNADGSFSPDGKQIVMVHQDGGGYSIATMNLDTGTTVRVSDGPLDEGPSYSPNGAMIVYDTNASRGKSLTIVSADGRVESPLETQGDAREAAWSPLVKHK